MGSRELDLSGLPEDCIENVLSLSGPRDTCRLSVISSLFRSAAESDAVWQKYLPPDYRSIIARSTDPSMLTRFSSLKDLYFNLCDNPILIDGAKLSFWLDKSTGKKCYMLCARNLRIIWGDTPMYWKWTSEPECRFGEVAELISVCWLDIGGRISASLLSPATIYSAYLVFKLTTETYGFDHQPLEVSMGLAGAESPTGSVYLDAGRRRRQRYQTGRSRERKDGWFEIELGEFYNNEGEEGEIEMSVLEIKDLNGKRGLIVQGIEIRPKESDAVWQKYLPPDYRSIIARSTDPSILTRFSSLKDLYFCLCDNPILIDDAKLSFWLDKSTGKKCYMLCARNLVIIWGDTPRYWKWTSEPECRFGEVAELISVCWLDIRGRISASLLSPATFYSAYLVFKLTTETYGFDDQPLEVSMGLAGAESPTRSVYLDAGRRRRQRYQTGRRRIGLVSRMFMSGMQAPVPVVESDGPYPRERKDGWFEIELGEFYNNEGEEGEIEMSVLEIKVLNWKRGLIVQGIEIRPKEGR